MKTIIYAVQSVSVDTFAHWDTVKRKSLKSSQKNSLIFNLLKQKTKKQQSKFYTRFSQISTLKAYQERLTTPQSPTHWVEPIKKLQEQGLHRLHETSRLKDQIKEWHQAVACYQHCDPECLDVFSQWLRNTLNSKGDTAAC